MENSLTNLLIFMAIGFLAQLANGGMGAGFGVITNTILISMGIPPATSSSTIHTAEILTSGNLAFWHWKEQNIDKRIFLNLVFTGVVGGALGAYLLSQFQGSFLQIIIAVYLLGLGLIILRKGYLKKQTLIFGKYRILFSQKIADIISKFISFVSRRKPMTSRVFTGSLGFIAGALDAVGGGGWGAITTSTLVAKDEAPRYVIGSISAAEFFVTVTISFTFLVTLSIIGYWFMILGLVLGGLFAAPISAKMCRYLPDFVLMILIGSLMTGLSLLILVPYFMKMF